MGKVMDFLQSNYFLLYKIATKEKERSTNMGIAVPIAGGMTDCLARIKLSICST
jgi:hypothetical protein